MKITDRPYNGIYNLDESKVPAWEVPSALTKMDGSQVRTAADWFSSRRPELLKLFEEQMFGWMPPRPDKMFFEVLSEKRDALDGTAVRKEIRIHCETKFGGEKHFDLLLFLPANARGPVPCILGLNGRGNHSATSDPEIRITDQPVVNIRELEAFATRPPDESTRGTMIEYNNIKGIIKRGYAAATLCISEIFYDSLEGFKSSIYRLFLPQDQLEGDRHPFGAIGAWAWGLSRALDCLENEPAVDAKRTAVYGHSRLGKTALWAGAYDPRFALIISSQSGCSGASLSRRQFGETIDFLLFWRTYWFCENFQQYRNNEKNMPFDQNMLIALAAPRPVHVASAWGDLHSDPKGEYVAAAAASEVYELLGADCSALKSPEVPPCDVLAGNELSYHIRQGDHVISFADWDIYFKLCDKYLKRI